MCIDFLWSLSIKHDNLFQDLCPDFGVIKFVGVKYIGSCADRNAFVICIGTWMLELEIKLEL